MSNRLNLTADQWEKTCDNWRESRAQWLGLLLDAWTQFCIQDEAKRRWWAGGRSVLEDIESCLKDEGIIDENGLPTEKGLL